MKHATAADTKLLICVWHPFVLWRPPAEMAERVRKRFPEMRVVHLPDYDHLKEELPDTDIFVGYSLRPEQLAWAKRLKWIHSTAAAVAQLMYPELRRSGVVVTNASGVHSIPMAEHILGAIIALARRFPDCFRFQQQHRWAQQELWSAPVKPREIKGQVLFLVGFGAIGRQVAKCVRPLGMRIWAVTRSGRGDANLAEKIFPAEKLLEVLPESDFVVLAAPETPETRQMFGAREFAAMKPTAYFLNVARGALLVESAFAEALANHRIAGAAIDVASEEPLPPESPLWKIENLLITPHVSATTEHLWERQADLLLENLDRWFGGRELRNRVDLDRGY